jgi:hypothetical protein
MSGKRQKTSKKKLLTSKKFLALAALAIIFGSVVTVMLYNYITFAREGPYIDLLLHYSDGTSRPILSPGLQRAPMDIVDPVNNKLVESVDVRLHMVAIFDGPVNSYTVTAQMQWDLLSTGNVILATLVPAQGISYPGGILQSGDDVVVYSYSLVLIGSGAATKNWNGWVDNTEYQFAIYSPISMTVTLNFGDPAAPTPITKTAVVGIAYWRFRYDYPFAFTSLGASWTGIPQYSPYV